MTLFLAERGLAFRGDEEVLGSPHNGDFLGFVEVLAKYDPVLEEHLERVRTKKITLDVEQKLIDDLVNELIALRNNFDSIVQEAEAVASVKRIATFKEIEAEGARDGPKKPKTKRKTFFDEDDEEIALDNESKVLTLEEKFKYDVFYCLMDSLLQNLKDRYKAVYEIDALFNVLWLCIKMAEEEIQESCKRLSEKYKKDVSDINGEVLHLKVVRDSCFGKSALESIELLNQIYENGFASLYPNVSVLLGIFCTLTVTVASGERSFSKLAIIGNPKRATMAQERLNGLAILSIECELARKIDFDDIILRFAEERARKVNM